MTLESALPVRRIGILNLRPNADNAMIIGENLRGVQDAGEIMGMCVLHAKKAKERYMTTANLTIISEIPKTSSAQINTHSHLAWNEFVYFKMTIARMNGGIAVQASEIQRLSIKLSSLTLKMKRLRT